MSEVSHPFMQGQKIIHDHKIILIFLLLKSYNVFYNL